MAPGCPLSWDIQWSETPQHYCAPYELGLNENYTRSECETLCFNNPKCSAYSYSVLYAECMMTNGQQCTLEMSTDVKIFIFSYFLQATEMTDNW